MIPVKQEHQWYNSQRVLDCGIETRSGQATLQKWYCCFSAKHVTSVGKKESMSK